MRLALTALSGFASLAWMAWLAASETRTYHRVPLEKMATTSRTHVETCGLVVYVRKQQDGDVHITLERAGAKIVLEIIPSIPLPVPRKGSLIRARGITRIDRGHGGWAELHPLEGWEVAPRCP